MRLSALTVALGLVASVARPDRAGHVAPWQPANISSSQFESHAAFDPQSRDFYFVRSSPQFRGWRILFSHCGASGWSAPQDAPFSGDGVEADPWFTPDGRSLYFISTRSSDGVKREDLDIWRIERSGDGRWGEPLRLPEPVNSHGNEWFPRVAIDGWLYFGSKRPGGHGKTDIWRAREQGGHWIAENAGPAINSAGDEYEPLPAPDGSWMLVEGDGQLYRVRREGNGWSRREKLPEAINANGSEIGAAFSPSGRTVLFSRDTKGPLSGEFLIWHAGAAEAWPPQCPKS